MNPVGAPALLHTTDHEATGRQRVLFGESLDTCVQVLRGRCPGPRKREDRTQRQAGFCCCYEELWGSECEFQLAVEGLSHCGSHHGYLHVGLGSEGGLASCADP